MSLHAHGSFAEWPRQGSLRAMRPDGRRPDQLRPLEIITGFQKHAEGSALIKLGDTWVLCAASVENGVPPFLVGKNQGWLTAEYAMLPRSTHTRMDREAAKGALERVLAWDFDRIVLAHGDVVAERGRDVLRESFAWL